jgi:hypothetical protein
LHNVAPPTSLEGGKLQIKCNNISFYKQTRNYSTILSPADQQSRYKGKILNSDPLFFTGLFDAEGSFIIIIINNPKLVKGWQVQARIQIKMHENDRALIQSIQEFFGWIGHVSKPNNYSMVEFRVSTVKDLVDVIIPHFDNYPLNTKKYLDYLLFKNNFFKLLNKEHNTYEGLQDIVNIRSSLNLGLSNELKKAFPGTVPAIRPEFLLKNISGPSWLAGFATGESNFFITVQKSKSKSGLTISLRFSISQHSRDVLLLESLVNYFGCGYVAKYEKRSVCEFIVTKIDHIVENIIPFFDKQFQFKLKLKAS